MYYVIQIMMNKTFLQPRWQLLLCYSIKVTVVVSTSIALHLFSVEELYRWTFCVTNCLLEWTKGLFGLKCRILKRPKLVLNRQYPNGSRFSAHLIMCSCFATTNCYNIYNNIPVYSSATSVFHNDSSQYDKSSYWLISISVGFNWMYVIPEHFRAKICSFIFFSRAIPADLLMII